MINIADLFCGAGGESTGIIQALGEMGSRYDLAAVNHWEMAIKTHTANHPQARHYCTNLNHLNPHDVFSTRDRIDLLWASPECTHHSIARGGRPRSNQSRASSWLILKWLSDLYVRRVIIENVPEFVNWGPLGRNGKPLKSRRGDTFRAFINAIQSLGYRVEWHLLRAADYGDPTTRIRLFIQAVRGHGRISWPEPTHAQEPGLFGYRPWVPASEIIDWSIPGKSIFNRKKPLADNTIRRIEAGIKKYWGDWAKPFLVILRGESKTRAINLPLPTVTTSGAHYGLIEPFLTVFRGTGITRNINLPLPTVTASGSHYGLIEPFIMASGHTSSIRNRSLNEPLSTVVTKAEHSLVQPFLIKYYGQGLARSIELPLDTVTTKDRYALIDGNPYRLDIRFRMLLPYELAAAQGFPSNYWFAGNRSERVKQIGNAVPVNTAKALAISALAA